MLESQSRALKARIRA